MYSVILGWAGDGVSCRDIKDTAELEKYLKSMSNDGDVMVVIDRTDGKIVVVECLGEKWFCTRVFGRRYGFESRADGVVAYLRYNLKGAKNV